MKFISFNVDYNMLNISKWIQKKYYKKCCDPLKIHEKSVTKYTRPVPIDFLENADRRYDLKGDNYICVNHIHEFRKNKNQLIHLKIV